MTRTTKYVVAQLGRRMHYAVARILSGAGLLERFFTDVCAANGWAKVLRTMPASVRPPSLDRFLSRVPEGLNQEHITAFAGFGWRYAWRRTCAGTASEAMAANLWAGETFCRLILRHDLGAAGAVYAFNSAGLELLRQARSRGLHTILEQTAAPKELEQKLLAEEQERHPEWQPASRADGQVLRFIERERAEWNQADLILCGSRFVANAMADCGMEAGKVRVVPYGVPLGWLQGDRSHRGNGAPLRVLFVGGVGLRKGIPYLLETARAFRPSEAVFRAVGPVVCAPGALKSRCPSNVEVAGAVPRSKVARHYQWADVFLLPAICEGSATVVYEALAAGLPVITTPNAGSIVRDGVEGFIVPMRDSDAIVEAIERLGSDRSLLCEMSQAAGVRSAFGSLEAYGQRLLAALSNLGPKQ